MSDNGHSCRISALSPHPGQAGSKRAFHAMVKPLGSLCSLDCGCRYFLHKQELLGSNRKYRITETTGKHLLRMLRASAVSMPTPIVNRWRDGDSDICIFRNSSVVKESR